MNSETFTSTQEVSTDNVDVNSIEGLLSFREALTEVHDESRTLAEDLTNEHVRIALEKAEDVYAKTLSFVDRCIDSKEQGEELSDEDIDRLQEGYNALLEVLDVLSQRDSQNIEESVVDDVEEMVEESAETPETSHAEVSEVITSIPVFSTGTDISESELPQSKEEEALFIVALKNLRTEVEVSLGRAEEMLEKYQEITEVIATDAAINVGQHYYNQLGISAERARNTRVRLAEYIEKGSKLSELVLEHLKDTVEEIGENLDQLEKGLDQFFEADTEDEVSGTHVFSGSVGVGKEEDVEVAVPIVVKNKEPEPQTEEVSVAAPVSTVATPKVEGEIHHAPLESSFVQKAERAPRTALSDTIDHILEIPRYKQFAARTFHSKAHFEVTLRRQIQKIESQQTSGFFYDTFGYKYANAFETFLSTMTCPEIFEFDTKPYNFKIETLAQKNVKYETYLAWVDMMTSMFETTSAHKDITFGELFVRSELEELIEIEAAQQEAA